MVIVYISIRSKYSVAHLFGYVCSSFFGSYAIKWWTNWNGPKSAGRHGVCDANKWNKTKQFPFGLTLDRQRHCHTFSPVSSFTRTVIHRFVRCSTLNIFIIDYYSHYVLWKDFFSLAHRFFIILSFFFYQLSAWLSEQITAPRSSLMYERNFLLFDFKFIQVHFVWLYFCLDFASLENRTHCYCWILNNSCIKMIFLW